MGDSRPFAAAQSRKKQRHRVMGYVDYPLRVGMASNIRLLEGTVMATLKVLAITEITADSVSYETRDSHYTVLNPDNTKQTA